LPQERHVGTGLVLVVTFILFAVAAGWGYSVLMSMPVPDRFAVYVLLGMPLSASCLFMAASFSLPQLYADARLRFPVTATLPAVFLAMVVLSVSLWSSFGTGSYLVQPPEVLFLADLWREPRTLLTVWFLQFLGLTVAGQLRR
jgi:hypothetical protein